MIKIRDNGESWHGTNAERILNIPSSTQEGLKFYETDTLNVYIISGGIWVLYIAPVGANAMLWTGKWVEGTFEQYEVTRDESWTMIANKTTSDRPSPQPFGEDSYLLPTVPVWSPQSSSDVIWTGLRISNLVNSYLINSIRVWLPIVTSSVDYRVIIKDNITDQLSIGQIFTGDILPVAGWLTTHIEPVWLLPNDDITIWLLTENTSGTSSFNHTWGYIGDSTPNDNPGLGNVENRRQQRILRINKTDDGGTDRSADLTTVITGTTIRVANLSDPTRYYEYEVLDQTDNGAWISYNTLFIEEGTGGAPLQDLCQVLFTIPIPASTDYVEIVNEWTANPALNGELIIGSGAQSSTQDAYGVDISFQQYITSPDWDLVAHSNI